MTNYPIGTPSDLVQCCTLYGNARHIVELGDSAESKFDSIRFDRISIRFDSLVLRHPGLRPFMNWSALSNVVAKLLTVMSLGLSLNVGAQ